MRGTFPSCREAGYRVVFNLVDGLKSFHAYLKTIGRRHQQQAKYVAEEISRDPARRLGSEGVGHSAESGGLDDDEVPTPDFSYLLPGHEDATGRRWVKYPLGAAYKGKGNCWLGAGIPALRLAGVVQVKVTPGPTVCRRVVVRTVAYWNQAGLPLSERHWVGSGGPQ